MNHHLKSRIVILYLLVSVDHLKIMIQLAVHLFTQFLLKNLQDLGYNFQVTLDLGGQRCL